MTVSQQTPPTERHVIPAPPTCNGRWSGFSHLLMARMKELKREPEVIFWVFIFPLLLALGLGIAFRNKPADVTSIAIVEGPGADKAMALLESRKSSIRAEVLNQSLALQGFRLGKYDLVVEPDTNGFPHPRTVRDELDELWNVGNRIRFGGHAPTQAAQTLRSYPDATQRFFARAYQQSLGAHDH